MRLCPTCGHRAADDDAFCEIDGTRLGVAPAVDAGAGAPATGACARCGASTADADDGYCASCGHRLDPPSRGSVPPVVQETDCLASAVHPGLLRDHNEDAAALASGTTPSGDPFHVMVICDGVSSSSHAEQASAIAARVLRDSLAHFCRSGDAAFESLRGAVAEAIRDAHVGVCAQAIDYGDGEPPGTTCVAAVVLGDRAAVGWVGDSRAYWVTETEGQLLTRDHSWVNEVVASGVPLEEALRSPHAHALTRCLGPLESESPQAIVEADVVSRALVGPGVLLLCSDGLWNYYPEPEAMHAVVHQCATRGTPSALASFLVARALARGGQDNVSVVVCARGTASSSADGRTKV